MSGLAAPSAPPTPAWTPLRHHEQQQRLLSETWPFGETRFATVRAGRRGGKSMLIKRHALMSAPMIEHRDGLVVIGAPTHDDGKRIFWNDLKALVPPALLAGIRESELLLTLASVGGHSRVRVVGLDVPERARGDAIDQLYVDEFAFLRRAAWDEVLRPTLSTSGRLGGAWLVSTPRIRRDTRPAESAQRFRELDNLAASGADPEWGAYGWPSADILDAAEIESAKRTLDARTFAQEYEATWQSVEGRAYYAHDRTLHAKPALPYDPAQQLIVCLDFNTAPGVAVIGQEHPYDEGTKLWECLGPGLPLGPLVTCWIGLVWIERDSSTPAVCRKFIADWGSHRGEVLFDGDPTGGIAHTSSAEGPDWKIVRDYLRPTFGERLRIVHARRNPAQGARVAAVNARLLSGDGKVHMLIDSGRCEKLLRDLDEVQIKPGSAMEIWKPSGTMLTHVSDAIGYYIERKYGLTRARASTYELL
jgi:hypothetical protein